MPLAPNQLPRLFVLLHMWNLTKGCSRYEMQTLKGLIAVENIQEAREYSARNGYSGIEVIPT